MKIAPKDAEPFLAAPDKRCRALLLYGPDAGLVRTRLRAAAKQVLAGSDDPFARVELSEARLLADPALLADELSAISMLSPKRVVMIEGGDKLTKIIESAAECFHEGAFLIVASEELSARSSLRLWFEKEPACAALACYHDEARDIQTVVRQAMDEAGIRLSRDSMDYIAQQFGNDRGVTQQEIAKLVAYAGEERALEFEAVQSLIDYNRETGFDELVQAAADKNMAALEKTLTLLARDGMQPVAYLRALQRYFNRLYSIRAKMATGQSAEQVIQGLRPPVFFRQLPILTRHAQSWSSEHIVKALRLLALAEQDCKTSDLPPLPASGRRLLQLTQIR